MVRLLVVVLFAVAGWIPAHAQTDQTWIEQSNQHASVLLELTAHYQPESAAEYGLEQYDAQIIDLKPRVYERHLADLQQAIRTLERSHADVGDQRVRQDLAILLRSARELLKNAELDQRLMLPYINLAEFMYGGFNRLLDPQMPRKRRAAAL